MIFDTFDEKFKHIMEDKALHLPKRWDGNSFPDSVKELLDHYYTLVEKNTQNETGYCDKEFLNKLWCIISKLVIAIEEYQNGFPAEAFNVFCEVMENLSETPLLVYDKCGHAIEPFYNCDNDPLRLFRAVRVEDNKPFSRVRVFHTPYNLRSKVSTSRYSIAGHPSLYLGTSLELCCSEIKADPFKDLVLSSSFCIDREYEQTNVAVKVYELSIKPQDFIRNNQQFLNDNPQRIKRQVPEELTWNRKTKDAYLLWFPLIAACSFIRINKTDPFAAEYIIPQLLMQWVRCEMKKNLKETDDDKLLDKDIENPERKYSLIGIRYFSCASKRDSEKGTNYVFPSSGISISAELPYCSVLEKAFLISEPKYIHEFDSIIACENTLLRDGEYKKLNNK